MRQMVDYLWWTFRHILIRSFPKIDFRIPAHQVYQSWRLRLTISRVIGLDNPLFAFLPRIKVASIPGYMVYRKELSLLTLKEFELLPFNLNIINLLIWKKNFLNDYQSKILFP